MGMQYVNAGVSIPYSLSRGIGSLSYALLLSLIHILDDGDQTFSLTFAALPRRSRR